ncbi:carbon monoxide dehydrogenase [Sandarakinorhabdus cyanobacteriorum]|uniref:Carbon monoxide dehydrogenase n=1 Tax=Sandarakinorhabdus cyanobacteriorum TaxID=1981098 RepID=A0A255Y8C0_9SPHN|nr:FAD binding domain-containing protein [Sandarakinorhabdus cyanobacteriorum]OYQ24974.1 carbon monoxide dehydrogenase [Sandarakinorhabdus cyanobacteriorum]
MRDFALVRPASLADAAAAFSGGGEAAYLAGGHTLIPAMKSRLRMPDALVDLSGLGLSGITRDGNRLWIGAMTRHADVATGATAIPGLAALASGIGDAQVRNRGTLGGSVANNDPAADYPAACLALDALIETDRGSHTADDFFQGMFTTALADGEIITRIGFSIPARSAYAKFRHPASRYAVVGVYVADHGGQWRVAVTGAGPGVFRWAEAEAAIAAGGALPAMPADDLNSDIHAGPDYRAHLCGVMLKQALACLA